MDNEYNHVYIDIDNSGIKDNEIEVNPEYVYLTIPSDWVLWAETLSCEIVYEVVKSCPAPNNPPLVYKVIVDIGKPFFTNP